MVAHRCYNDLISIKRSLNKVRKGFEVRGSPQRNSESGGVLSCLVLSFLSLSLKVCVCEGCKCLT